MKVYKFSVYSHKAPIQIEQFYSKYNRWRMSAKVKYKLSSYCYMLQILVQTSGENNRSVWVLYFIFTPGCLVLKHYAYV